jgi:hypothetical protein
MVPVPDTISSGTPDAVRWTLEDAVGSDVPPFIVEELGLIVYPDEINESRGVHVRLVDEIVPRSATGL